MTKRDKMNPNETVRLPFEMKAPWSTKIGAILIVLFVTFLATTLFLFSLKGGPLWHYLVLTPFVLVFYIWTLGLVTNVRCNEEGMIFSTCFIPFSKISWKEITRVQTQRRGGGLGTTPFTQPNIYIHHEKAFLGLSTAVNRISYRNEDLATLRHLLRKRAIYAKFEQERP